MYDFFYNFHKKPLGWDLFNRSQDDGTPSPPVSQELLDNDGVVLLDNDGEILIN